MEAGEVINRPGRTGSVRAGPCRQDSARAASRCISPPCGRPSPTRSLPPRPSPTGPGRIAWGEFELRAARLAGALRAHGLGPGSVVACYLYNCPEYFETFLAALKIRAVPANVNYRYGGAELRALLENCEAEALFFDSALRERVASIRHEVPGVRLLVEVGEGSCAVRLPGACGYQELIASSEPAPRMSRRRAGCLLVVHGRDHRPAQGRPVHDRPRRGQLAPVARGVPRHEHRARHRGLRGRAGTQRPSPGLHPGLAAHAQHRVHLRLAPHADLGRAGGHARGPVIRRPRAPRHDRRGPGPGRRDRRRRVRAPAAACPGRRCAGRPLRHLIAATICSAGTAWSARIKQRLLEHLPQAALLDFCGSTEGVTYGFRRVRRGDPAVTASFEAARGLRVIGPDRRELPRGRGRPAGRPHARSGLPQGPAAKRHHLFHQRRRAARCARRPRPDRGRRQRDADRPGYQRDQHGRREGPPGGGGGGPQRAGRCRGVPGHGRP